MTDPLCSFGAFTRAVQARLALGAAAYQDRPAASRPLPELAAELMAECEDLAGWSACLWPRLVALRERLADLETALPAAETAPAGPPSDGHRVGVQLDPATFAEPVAMAARLRMPPTLTLKLALRALDAELARPRQERASMLVGAERGLPEGKSDG